MDTNIFTFTIQPDDIDLSGLSTIPSLYRKIINSIALNLRNEGYGIDVMSDRGMTWALARCGFEFSRRPELYSNIEIGVYKGREDAICYERNIEIRDPQGYLIGTGITDWCVLDKNTHRPVISRLESTLVPRNVTCGKPKRINFSGTDNEVVGRVGYSECDFNGHLNNCRYVDWFFNLLPEHVTSRIRPIRLDVNFKNEVKRGSEIHASVKEFGESEVNFCLRQNSNVACMASLSFI